MTVAVPTRDEVVRRIEAGLCPVDAVDLEPMLSDAERRGGGLGVIYPRGSRICPICGTGWTAWYDEAGHAHYGQVGGNLGPRPRHPEEQT